ncbi:hypothetical protein C8Q70DRAFT_755607 [Cubamyces menziesii]|nr:hypothetical protein C8Q70DRAFT_755607 [Cubamyces menziesii]
MAKPKKQKAKAATPDQPASAQPEQSHIDPAVRVKSPSHDVRANSPAAEEGGGYDEWGAPGHVGSQDSAVDWGGDGASAPAVDTWGEPGAVAPAGEWGAPPGDNWGSSPAAADEVWGAAESPVSATGGGFGSKKGATKKGGAHSHSQQQSAHPAPQPTQAPAHTSFHPSAAAHMASSHYGAQHASQTWGIATASEWGAPGGWSAPAPPPKPPPAPQNSAKPAWANWANEAKKLPTVNTQPVRTTSYSYPNPNAAAGGGARPVLSDQQRSQILNSLLQAPDNQYTKDFSQAQAQQSHHARPSGSQHQQARTQQPLHPSQQWQDPHFLAEQQSIWRSIQETQPQPQHGQNHPQPIQHADSWGYMSGGGWGERASTIPEEDEYEDEEDEEEEDDWGNGMGGNKGYDWGTGQASNGRVRFSPNISYSSSPRHRASSGPPGHAMADPHQRHSTHSHPQQLWAPSPVASRTMKMATGQISTTVFELAPPRNGMGELSFIDSRGAAIRPAERAFFNRGRPAKERFRWGFNPDKDPRVGTLLRWIASTANGLATMGLQRFLETQEKGALFFNADYRVPAPTPGAPPQPAYDWITLDKLQRTLDATLQESVSLYDPAFQVIVFVFLLSPSGNSMALWRRKLNVPDSVRDAHHDDILAVKAELKDYPVYVDEDRLPVKPEAAAPKKKKVRFAFLRRLFGGKKAAAAAS